MKAKIEHRGHPAEARVGIIESRHNGTATVAVGLGEKYRISLDGRRSMVKGHKLPHFGDPIKSLALPDVGCSVVFVPCEPPDGHGLLLCRLWVTTQSYFNVGGKLY